jgi:hypothetical protein
MQPGIAAHAAGVRKQPWIVGGEALQERFDRALDLEVARRRVTEQGAVVDQRADQIQDQVEIDVAAQVAARAGPVEGLPDRRARRVEQRGHERRAQLAVAGAVSEQGTEHAGGHAPERGDEHL